MAPLSLGELARLLGARLHGADPSLVIRGVAEPAGARPGQVAMLTDPRRIHEGRRSAASAFVVRRVVEDLLAPQLVLDASDPARALALLLERFGSEKEPREVGIDPRAAVADGAEVDARAWVGPFVYIGAGARVGSGSRIEPFSYVGAGVRIGARCSIGPGATVLTGSTVGDRTTLGPGSVVGRRGFGFHRDAQGWQPIPAPGGVTLGRDVELGAGSCVDAGTLSPTRVGDGVKIDNLV